MWPPLLAHRDIHIQERRGARLPNGALHQRGVHVLGRRVRGGAAVGVRAPEPRPRSGRAAVAAVNCKREQAREGFGYDGARDSGRPASIVSPSP